MASGEWRIIASIPSCRNLTRCSRLDLKAVYKQSSDTTLLTRAYVLIAIIRKQLQLPLSLHEMLQILSVTPFENVPLFQLLTETQHATYSDASRNQLNLF